MSNTKKLVKYSFNFLISLGFLFGLSHSSWFDHNVNIGIVTRGQNIEDHTSRVCSVDLATAIDKIINRPDLKRSRWGILVQNLDSARDIYSLNADQYFVPASSAKLLTTAAILQQFGADYRIETPIYSQGKLPNLESLLVMGQGDPSLSTSSLKSIVQELKQQGVQRIEKLIVDDSYFPQPTINPTWEWSDIQNYYATAVNSLILNENAVRFTILPQKLGQPLKFVWSDKIAARQWQIDNQSLTAPANTPYNVMINGLLGQPILQLQGELAVNASSDIWDLAIADPATYFLESLRQELSLAGITVTQGIVAQASSEIDRGNIITTIKSPPVSELIAVTNQDSNNLYAEALLQVLAKKTNTDNINEAIIYSLNQLDIDSESYHIVDGSGLSRHNLLTPEILVQVLSKIDRTPFKAAFRDSLAVAGVSGTLKNRLRNTPLQANLSGKTGALTGVTTLAGYLDLPGKETLVLSIFVNNSDLSGKELRQAIDDILLAVTNAINNC